MEGCSQRPGGISLNDADLAALLCVVAGSLERQGQPSSGGVLRNAARRLLELSASTPSPVRADGCAGCGAALVQQATGRRRRWCSERCRKRVRKVSIAS